MFKENQGTYKYTSFLSSTKTKHTDDSSFVDLVRKDLDSKTSRESHTYEFQELTLSCSGLYKTILEDCRQYLHILKNLRDCHALVTTVKCKCCGYIYGIYIV